MSCSRHPVASGVVSTGDYYVWQAAGYAELPSAATRIYLMSYQGFTAASMYSTNMTFIGSVAVTTTPEPSLSLTATPLPVTVKPINTLAAYQTGSPNSKYWDFDVTAREVVIDFAMLGQSAAGKICFLLGDSKTEVFNANYYGSSSWQYKGNLDGTTVNIAKGCFLYTDTYASSTNKGYLFSGSVRFYHIGNDVWTYTVSFTRHPYNMTINYYTWQSAGTVSLPSSATRVYLQSYTDITATGTITTNQAFTGSVAVTPLLDTSLIPKVEIYFSFPTTYKSVFKDASTTFSNLNLPVPTNPDLETKALKDNMYFNYDIDGSISCRFQERCEGTLCGGCYIHKSGCAGGKGTCKARVYTGGKCKTYTGNEELCGCFAGCSHYVDRKYTYTVYSPPPEAYFPGYIRMEYVSGRQDPPTAGTTTTPPATTLNPNGYYVFKATYDLSLFDTVSKWLVLTALVKNPTYNAGLSAGQKTSNDQQLAKIQEEYGHTTPLPTTISTTTIPMNKMTIWLDATNASNWVAGEWTNNATNKVGGNAKTFKGAWRNENRVLNAINGLPGIYFDGTNALSVADPAGTYALSTDPTRSITFFVVFKTTGSDLNKTLLSRTTGRGVPSPFNMFEKKRTLGSAGSYDTFPNTIYTNTINLNGLSQDVPYIYTYRLFGASIPVQSGTSPRINEFLKEKPGNNVFKEQPGPLVGTKACADTATALYIGTSNDQTTSFTGYISEVLVYNVSLSNDEVVAVNNYLANKWRF
jgi:hypothetical protein